MGEELELQYYSAIRLPESQDFAGYSIEQPKETQSGATTKLDLFGLLPINFFVGPNNSGKSRFMREVLKRKFAGWQYDDLKPENYFGPIEEYKEKINFELGKIRIIDGSIHSIIESDDKFKKLLSKPNFFDDNHSIVQEFTAVLQSPIQVNANLGTLYEHSDVVNAANENIKKISDSFINKYRHVLAINTIQPQRVYIPILRGMRGILSDKSKKDEDRIDHYHQRTTDDYKIDSVEVFTGLGIYKDLKNHLLGEPSQRDLIRQYEDFLAKYFFDGKQVTLIPKVNDDVVHIKIGDEDQFPIYNLGDGLQSLIILTYPMFTKTEKTLFFIEEPEMYLHPGFQRQFIEVLHSVSELKKHQYFFTTHSNHLLDMTLDYSPIAVFHFNKKSSELPTFEIKNVSHTDRQLLNDLGVKNSSVFLSNATIWVEGITDRKYIRAYLQKYLEENPSLIRFREDYHYSFVEYQGSNITHWDFGSDNNQEKERMNAGFLCAHAFVVADGDVANKADREKNLKTILGNRFLILDCKEIENLIPEKIVAKLAENKFVEHSVETTEIKYEKYSISESGLGKYLDKLVGQKECFATKTGTIKNKVDFCNKAIEFMQTEDWELTPTIEDICKKIYEHIQSQNQ